jgi:type 1 glutamine amidotransferase
MMRCGVLLLMLAAQAPPAKKAKIVLIGKDPDHGRTTHEYMPDSELLAKCLRQTAGVEAVVSNGWPKDEVLRDVTAIVLNTRLGGDVLFAEANRAKAIELMDKGVGLAAIHWGTGAEGPEAERYLKTLGGCFNVKFSKYLVQKATLRRVDPAHPVCFGWEDYELREEYYIKLKFEEKAKPVFQATIKGEEYTIGWTYEREGGGRSFGFVGGHFHDNFGIDAFRRSVVNGILWTAGVDVPKQGAPCKIEAADLELPK